MLARLNAPVIGANPATATTAEPWQVGAAWRYQRSDKHFRGSHEETNREAEHSEVINTINLLDLSITRSLGPRWTVSVGIPYVMNERSSPIRNDEREVVGRYVNQARGLGDITVSAKRWMADPSCTPGGNVAIGFGLKLPTGAANVVDTRVSWTEDGYERELRTVDQSIQPGDGGLGFLVDIQAFKSFGSSISGYFSAVYLFNPEGTSGVQTYRRESEAVMSIADQYLARAGASWSFSDEWSLQLGGRLEGAPVEDAFGSSEGFRRPGYAVSVEPGLSWSRGSHGAVLSVPWALQRNRERSVPDYQDPGRHGDAAFADWVLLLGYFRRF